jgi:hypothetical protein
MSNVIGDTFIEWYINNVKAEDIGFFLGHPVVMRKLSI